MSGWIVRPWMAHRPFCEKWQSSVWEKVALWVGTRRGHEGWLCQLFWNRASLMTEQRNCLVKQSSILWLPSHRLTPFLLPLLVLWRCEGFQLLLPGIAGLEWSVFFVLLLLFWHVAQPREEQEGWWKWLACCHGYQLIDIHVWLFDHEFGSIVCPELVYVCLYMYRYDALYVYSPRGSCYTPGTGSTFSHLWQKGGHSRLSGVWLRRTIVH